MTRGRCVLSLRREDIPGPRKWARQPLDSSPSAANAFARRSNPGTSERQQALYSVKCGNGLLVRSGSTETRDLIPPPRRPKVRSTAPKLNDSPRYTARIVRNRRQGPDRAFSKVARDEARCWRISKVSGRCSSHCRRVRGCSAILGVQNLGASGFICAREGGINWLPPAASWALASAGIYPYPRGSCSKEHAVQVPGPFKSCPRRCERFLPSPGKWVQ